MLRFAQHDVRRVTLLFVTLLWIATGCANLQIGDSTVDADMPIEDTPTMDQPIVDADSPVDEPDTTAPEENEPPTAIAKPRFGASRDVILDGRANAQAFVDGSGSFDRDGEIVSWEWRINGAPVAVGEIATIVSVPIGVTRVTLLVTDDAGTTDFDEMDIVNPGFRPGRWRGTTSQGHDVSFEITSDFRAREVTFGFEFNGQNLLNGVPCPFVEPGVVCTTCTESVEACALDFAWGLPTEAFALAGECVEDGDPPYTRASGVVAAAPSSNCAGSVDGITWEALWVSE